jgi:hypothetical protein
MFMLVLQTGFGESSSLVRQLDIRRRASGDVNSCVGQAGIGVATTAALDHTVCNSAPQSTPQNQRHLANHT